MTEKFLIIKQLDTEKLDTRIDKFMTVNNYDPYVFTSKETISVLISHETDDLGDKLSKLIFDYMFLKEQGYSCMYQGYKMFEDNTLEFGEIELR